MMDRSNERRWRICAASCRSRWLGAAEHAGHSPGKGRVLFLSLLRAIVVATILLSTRSLHAGTPKDLIAEAARRLAELANYTSQKTIKSAMNRPGGQDISMEERIVKDVSYQSVKYPPFVHEMLRKGNEQASRDGTNKDWVTVGVANGQSPSLTNSVQTLLAGVEELKEVDGVYSGNLTETAAKAIAGGPGGMSPPVTAAKGSVRFWIKDGLLSRYELVLSSQATEPDGKSREINSTTTVNITNVGTTKIPVPDAVIKGLFD